MSDKENWVKINNAKYQYPGIFSVKHNVSTTHPITLNFHLVVNQIRIFYGMIYNSQKGRSITTHWCLMLVGKSRS